MCANLLCATLFPTTSAIKLLLEQRSHTKQTTEQWSHDRNKHRMSFRIFQHELTQPCKNNVKNNAQNNPHTLIILCRIAAETLREPSYAHNLVSHWSWKTGFFFVTAKIAV